PGWNLSGIGCVGSMPELNCEATCGLYTVLVFAPSCVTSIAIFGGKSVNPWCAQIGPPGRPSMGPVSPACTPSSAGFSGCWVRLACAVGDGLGKGNGFGLRASTSKRGIGVEKSWTPNRGLDGRPVGIESAYALRTNGLRPCFATSTPPAVNKPHLSRSRRETCPCDQALRISQRFLRARSASSIRRLELFLDRKKDMQRLLFGCLRLETLRESARGATRSRTPCLNGTPVSGPASLMRTRQVIVLCRCFS